MAAQSSTIIKNKINLFKSFKNRFSDQIEICCFFNGFPKCSPHTFYQFHLHEITKNSVKISEILKNSDNFYDNFHKNVDIEM